MTELASRAHRRRSHRHLGFAGMAPFVQAAGSIVVQLIAARELGAEGLATWALMFSVLVLLTALLSGLVGDSLTVLDRTASRTRAGLQAWTLLLASGGALAAAVGLRLSGMITTATAALLAVTAFVFCVQEVLRRLLMASERFGSVIAVDAATATVTVGGALAAAVQGSVSVEVLLGFVLVGQLVGVVTGAARVPSNERHVTGLRGADLRGVFAFGRWRAVQASARPSALVATRAVAILAVGAGAVGPVEAARIFAAPVGLLVSGAASFLIVRFSRRARRGTALSIRELDRAAGGLGAVALVMATAAVGAAYLLGGLVTAGQYELPLVAVFAWGLYSSCLAMSMPYGTAAAVNGRPAAVAGTRLAEGVVAIGLVALLMGVVDLQATILPWALALSTSLTVPVLRRMARKAARTT